jgi:hypothetical protein
VFESLRAKYTKGEPLTDASSIDPDSFVSDEIKYKLADYYMRYSFTRVESYKDFFKIIWELIPDDEKLLLYNTDRKQLSVKQFGKYVDAYMQTPEQARMIKEKKDERGEVGARKKLTDKIAEVIPYDEYLVLIKGSDYLDQVINAIAATVPDVERASFGLYASDAEVALAYFDDYIKSGNALPTPKVEEKPSERIIDKYNDQIPVGSPFNTADQIRVKYQERTGKQLDNLDRFVSRVVNSIPIEQRLDYPSDYNEAALMYMDAYLDEEELLSAATESTPVDASESRLVREHQEMLAISEHIPGSENRYLCNKILRSLWPEKATLGEFKNFKEAQAADDEELMCIYGDYNTILEQMSSKRRDEFVCKVLSSKDSDIGRLKLEKLSEYESMLKKIATELAEPMKCLL